MECGSHNCSNRPASSLVNRTFQNPPKENIDESRTQLQKKKEMKKIENVQDFISPSIDLAANSQFGIWEFYSSELAFYGLGFGAVASQFLSNQ